MLAVIIVCMQCSTVPKMTPGGTGRELPPCPTSPNCVSSLSEDESHYVTPLDYEGTVEEAKKTLIGVIRSMKRSKIVAAEGNYLHATFTSFLFRFVDDVEFFLDSKNRVLQMRSASRVGYYDFGANRSRIKALTQSLHELGFEELRESRVKKELAEGGTP